MNRLIGAFVRLRIAIVAVPCCLRPRKFEHRSTAGWITRKWRRSRGPISSKSQLLVSKTASVQTVRYPSGPLSIGVTLYKIPEQASETGSFRLSKTTSSSRTMSGPIEIGRPATSKESSFPWAIWEAYPHPPGGVGQSAACSADDSSAGCKTSGVKLGDMDSFELPIPIDAWPRPVCNVEQLTSRGFFRWAETEGDFGGPQVPERFATMLATNDCFLRFSRPPGFGLLSSALARPTIAHSIIKPWILAGFCYGRMSCGT